MSRAVATWTVADRAPRWGIRKVLWGAFVFVLGAAPFIGSIGVPRFFVEGYAESLETLPTEGGLASVLQKLNSFSALALGLAGIAVGLSSKRVRKTGAWLWGGAMGLCAGPLLASRYGAVPSFSVAIVAIPMVLSAAYLIPAVSLDWLVRQLKRVCLLYALGSLGAVVVAPLWAMEWNYKASYIPGFMVRLHGIGGHANVLSSLLVGYLVLDWYRPGRRLRSHLAKLVVLLALVLTQSKTAWISAGLAFALFRLYRLPSMSRGKRYASVGGFGVGVALGMLVLGLDLGPSGALASNDSVTTLTGRTQVWAATVMLWSQNPTFGYGLELWGADMRLPYAASLGWAPPHAHNQFFQTLGESGVVGVVGLVAYYCVLLAYGWRYGRRSEGLAPALVLMLLLRGVTEPPFRMVLSDGNFFLHFVLFSVLMLTARDQPRLGDAGPHAG